jgi:tetratricopeptide (TPR) repeat protein
MTLRINLAVIATGLTLALIGPSASTLAQGPTPTNETPPTLPSLKAPAAVPTRAVVGANETPPTLLPMPAPSDESPPRLLSGASATDLPASKLISELETPKAFRGVPAAPVPASDIDVSFKLESLKSEAQAELTEGIRLAEKHAFKAAIYHLDAAISFDPLSALAYAWRAHALCETQAYDKAISDWNKAIELFPTELNFRHNRARIYLQKKEYNCALADVNLVISRLPNKRVEPYILRAQIFQAMRDGRAAGDFEQALRLSPDDQTSLIGLAWLYATSPDDSVRNGRRAIELATRACELTRWKSSYTIAALSAAHAEFGDFEAAIRWHDKVALDGLCGTLSGFLVRSRYVLRFPYRDGTTAPCPFDGENGIYFGVGWFENTGGFIDFRSTFMTGFRIGRLPCGLLIVVPMQRHGKDWPFPSFKYHASR